MTQYHDLLYFTSVLNQSNNEVHRTGIYHLKNQVLLEVNKKW